VTRRGRPYVRLTPDGATRELVDRRKASP